MIGLEGKISTPTSILNSSQELHYHSGYNKKTLERDVLKWWKAVSENGRKMGHLLSSTLWESKWLFFFSNHCTVGWWTLEGRGSAADTGCCHSREQTCWECDKEAFHVTRPGETLLFLRGHRQLIKETSKSGGGWSGFHYTFPSMNKGAYARNQYELTAL